MSPKSFVPQPLILTSRALTKLLLSLAPTNSIPDSEQECDNLRVPQFRARALPWDSSARRMGGIGLAANHASDNEPSGRSLI